MEIVNNALIAEVKGAPVLDPTVNPENEGIFTDDPGLVRNRKHEPSFDGAVILHGLVFPVIY